jgi:hypothetical protein
MKGDFWHRFHIHSELGLMVSCYYYEDWCMTYWAETPEMLMARAVGCGYFTPKQGTQYAPGGAYYHG